MNNDWSPERGLGRGPVSLLLGGSYGGAVAGVFEAQ